jgi:hypothetical protein
LKLQEASKIGLFSENRDADNFQNLINAAAEAELFFGNGRYQVSRERDRYLMVAASHAVTSREERSKITYERESS